MTLGGVRLNAEGGSESRGAATPPRDARVGSLAYTECRSRSRPTRLRERKREGQGGSAWLRESVADR